MKNLTKALGIAGITALSFLPMNGKGQTNYIKYLESSNDAAKMVELIDIDNDKKPDIYAEWRDFQDSIELISIYYNLLDSNKKEIISKTSFNLKQKRPRILKFKYISSEEAFMGDTLYAKNIPFFRNAPIGKSAINCKENYFEKKVKNFRF